MSIKLISLTPDLFSTCSLDKCFGDEPVLIVNTTNTEIQTKINEAEVITAEKIVDKTSEKGESETEFKESKSNDTDKDPKINPESEAKQQCGSLYLSLSHLLNLANNLGCVQRCTSIPENKVFVAPLIYLNNLSAM